MLRDPVLCADGHTYERDAIEEWLQRIDPRTNQPIYTSPLTNLALPNNHLSPNLALRNAITGWAERTFKVVASESVTLGPRIGAGAFKTVHQGQYMGRTVAVLRLRAGTCDTEAAVFLRLARRTGLVQYIGMCSTPEDQLLLTEFAPHGSLDNFMEEHGDEVGRPTGADRAACPSDTILFQASIRAPILLPLLHARPGDCCPQARDAPSDRCRHGGAGSRGAGASRPRHAQRPRVWL